jgi:Pyridoxamine 5'-phosphate oxidase
MTDELPGQEELTPRECMILLGSVSLGRIVFTARALPAVRLASHLVDGHHVIVRADASAPITSKLTPEVGTVVAYEADAVDPAEHLGWSVTVVGVAQQVTDPAAVTAFRRSLRHWAHGGRDQIVSIDTRMATGFRLVPRGTAMPSYLASRGLFAGVRPAADGRHDERRQGGRDR